MGSWPANPALLSQVTSLFTVLKSALVIICFTGLMIALVVLAIRALSPGKDGK